MDQDLVQKSNLIQLMDQCRKFSLCGRGNISGRRKVYSRKEEWCSHAVSICLQKRKKTECRGQVRLWCCTSKPVPEVSKKIKSLDLKV
jgi:hypothetical protein